MAEFISLLTTLILLALKMVITYNLESLALQMPYVCLKWNQVSPLFLCSGADGQIASSFEVGIKEVRTASGDWTLYADLTGETNYIFQGSANDASVLIEAILALWTCIRLVMQVNFIMMMYT